MPVKGIKRVQMNTRKVLSDIAGQKTEKVILQALQEGEKHAVMITPVGKTSNLINHRHIDIKETATGVEGRLKYTSDYAAYVHEASGKLKGQPRSDGSGNYWDPNGEPEFLKKGFERDGLDEIKAIIKQGYKV
ncbi:hypothetical protein [Enterobacter hormaechei]|uniref:hypothetical protein n=1 Tax=Enterobacter hormaechei TaxID=158836 RepID=UPI00125C567E|nr:hypothetical protein [Enterobacter hormaechei]VAF08928.1 Uncharacterised protein [Enterobacter hormaechei]